jgi:pimeloyl-ACP methyl ester carboxylesterase
MAQIVLPHGRTLAYQVLGDPSGPPLVVLHGTPGSSRQVACLDRAARDHGLALVAPDRAGYGGSSYDSARSIATSAHDVGAVLTHLGLPRCPVIGLSGGGPTALACGVLLPDQVVAVATVGGVAPMVPRDPLLPPDRLVIRAARHSEAGVQAMLSVMIRAGRRPERSLERFAALLAEPDARLLRHDPDVRRAFLDDIAHPSPTAARAAARDFRLFARPWDIDLAGLTVPAQIWHGSEDRNVPVAHARVIAARCPTAQLHLIEGGGHMPLSHADEIIASVLPR